MPAILNKNNNVHNSHLGKICAYGYIFYLNLAKRA